MGQKYDKRLIGGLSSIQEYVERQMSLFENSNRDMKSLFGLMFSLPGNAICESTDGYRIKKVTYGESLANVHERTRQILTLLKGVEKGAMVGIYLENSVEWIEIFWAILQAGFKPLLMNMRLPDELLCKVVKENGVALVISNGKDFGTLNYTVSELAKVEATEEIDESAFEDEVFLMSSNTSGTLKICGYTGECFYYQIADSVKIFHKSKSIKRIYNGDLKLLAFLPFYHIFGLVAVYIWFGFFSRPFIFLPDLAPDTIINTVKKHGITHIFAVPLFWEKLYSAAMAGIKARGEKTFKKFEKGMKIVDKLSKFPRLAKLFSKVAFKEVRENIFGESVSFMISGGGHISQDVLKFINGIGYHFVNGYGMTELGITSVELSESMRQRNLGSVGKPFESLEYQINDEGELLVRGKSIAYEICAGGKRQIVDKDEWFNTHDLFTKKGDKYYIDGRKDDLIVLSNGENINPNLIEPCLYCDGVERVCVTPANGGKIAVIVGLKKFIGKDKVLEIEREIHAKVEALKLTSETAAVALTFTPLLEGDDFKLNRKRIAVRYGSGALRIIGSDAPEAEIDEEDRELAEKLTAIFAKALNMDASEIKPDAHFFFDLGGSSLDFFGVVNDIRTELGIPLQIGADFSATTVRELAEYIKKQA